MTDAVLPASSQPTSALVLSLQQAQELYWILDVFRLRLDSTLVEAEHIRDQLQAGALLPGDGATLADIRQTCADILGVTLDRRDDTRSLFRRVIERGQADARRLRDLVGQAEVRLDLLSKYASGQRSGSTEQADAYRAEAVRSLADGNLINAANAQALCLINRLLVALDEQGRESERRHRVADEDIAKHQGSGAELARLVNEAHTVLNGLGVPKCVSPHERELVGRIRFLAAKASDAETEWRQADQAHARVQAKFRALAPVIHAAAQIMGVQAVDPANEEEGREFAAKLHERANRARSIAELVPMSWRAVADFAGVPGLATDEAAQQRVVLGARLISEIRKHVAVALLEEQATTDDALIEQVARVSALAAQARCALGVLSAMDPYVTGQRVPTTDEACAYHGAGCTAADQGLPLLARANAIVAEAIMSRALVRSCGALLDEVEVPRPEGASLTDRIRALIRQRQPSRLPEIEEG